MSATSTGLGAGELGGMGGPNTGTGAYGGTGSFMGDVKGMRAALGDLITGGSGWGGLFGGAGSGTIGNGTLGNTGGASTTNNIENTNASMGIDLNAALGSLGNGPQAVNALGGSGSTGGTANVNVGPGANAAPETAPDASPENRGGRVGKYYGGAASGLNLSPQQIADIQAMMQANNGLLPGMPAGYKPMTSMNAQPGQGLAGINMQAHPSQFMRGPSIQQPNNISVVGGLTHGVNDLKALQNDYNFFAGDNSNTQSNNSGPGLLSSIGSALGFASGGLAGRGHYANAGSVYTSAGQEAAIPDYSSNIDLSIPDVPFNPPQIQQPQTSSKGSSGGGLGGLLKDLAGIGSVIGALGGLKDGGSVDGRRGYATAGGVTDDPLNDLFNTITDDSKKSDDQSSFWQKLWATTPTNVLGGDKPNYDPTYTSPDPIADATRLASKAIQNARVQKDAQNLSEATKNFSTDPNVLSGMTGGKLPSTDDAAANFATEPNILSGMTGGRLPSTVVSNTSIPANNAATAANYTPPVTPGPGAGTPTATTGATSPAGLAPPTDFAPPSGPAAPSTGLAPSSLGPYEQLQNQPLNWFQRNQDVLGGIAGAIGGMRGARNPIAALLGAVGGGASGYSAGQNALGAQAAREATTAATPVNAQANIMNAQTQRIKTGLEAMGAVGQYFKPEYDTNGIPTGNWVNTLTQQSIPASQMMGIVSGAGALVSPNLSNIFGGQAPTGKGSIGNVGGSINPTEYSTIQTPPKDYAPYVEQYAAQYNVPMNVAQWLGTHESNWNPNAQGNNVSGVFQFKPGTYQDYANPVLANGKLDPLHPEQSTDAAMHYLSDLYKKTGSWEKAIEQYGTFSTGKGPEMDQAVRQGFRMMMNGTQGAGSAGGAGGAGQPQQPPSSYPTNSYPYLRDKANQLAQLIAQHGSNMSPGALDVLKTTQQQAQESYEPYVKNLTENRAYQANLSNGQANNQQAIQQLTQVQNILTKLETGKLTPPISDVSAWAKSILPPKTFDAISGSHKDDPALAQELLKGSIKQIYQNLSQVPGVVTDTKLQGMGQAVENAGLDPETNRRIVANLLGAARQNKDYASDVINRMGTTNDQLGLFNRGVYQNQWLAQPEHDLDKRYTEEAYNNMPVKGGTPSSTDKMHPGAQYIVEPGQVIDNHTINQGGLYRFVVVNGKKQLVPEGD